MKNFHYHNTEKCVRAGKHITRKVVVKKGKGYKSITIKRGGKRNRTVKKMLNKDEIEKIRKGKFIKGLFKDCKSGNC
uniref:Uncharacterized protein n=1 Tax=viral metagenome TaxID=1070528 RepID=A0A6C0B6B4_9ZZZZ